MLNYTIIEILQIFVIPLIAIVSPIVYMTANIVQKKFAFSFNRNTKLKLGAYWLIIFLFIFSILLYLTGGIGFYYRLEKGFFVDDRQIVWNATSRLNIVIPFNPGVGLFAVSVLGGLLYASMLALPKYCIIPRDSEIAIIENANQQTDQLTNSNKLSSTTSSITSAGSALTSVPVCCSTSFVSVILPTSATLLAPVAPALMIGSLGLMLFQIKRNVFPRFRY